ncbi:mevalonate kinase-like isoform X2 [Gigantopelta aegis]|nr:mevalonate kinase-like isoform X2 [Gigantopelta aegis]
MRLSRTQDGMLTVNLPNISVKASWPVETIKSCFSLPFIDTPTPQLDKVTPDILNQIKEFANIDKDSAQTTELAVVALLFLYGSIAAKTGTLPSITICVLSKLPASAGLGSSAAYSVCLVTGLLSLSGLIQEHAAGDRHEGMWSKEELLLINSWAFIGEKIIHGNPSGIDNSISTFGGAIRFQAGKISRLDKMPPLRILLVNTKVPRSTKLLVAGVKERYTKYPYVMKSVMDTTEAITNICQEVLSQMAEKESGEYYTMLEDFIDINQHQLGAMGVSHPSLDQIVLVSAKYGLHTKLTGAGGGGCTFTLIRPDTPPDTISALRQELENLGFSSWETKLGSFGIIQHFSSNGTFDIPVNL